MEKNTIDQQLSAFLSGLSKDDRCEVAKKLIEVINRELLAAEYSEEAFRCPACQGTEFWKYGRTAAGTSRFKCKCCGKVRCDIRTGNILGNTKLDPSVWKAYVPLFIDHVPSKRVSKEIGVSMQTAWFMRVRLLEAVFAYLPAFRVNAGCGAEIDEIYFRESFKGRKDWDEKITGRMPRSEKVRNYVSGISSDQICVMTALNDSGDFFFDVIGRGSLTYKQAKNCLKDRICSGAIVHTDAHRAYPRTMRELDVAVHDAVKAKEGRNLDSINHTHASIRAFFAPFRGVSTKWLHLYLTWFKWLKCFCDSSKSAAKQLANGSYTHTWRKICQSA